MFTRDEMNKNIILVYIYIRTKEFFGGRNHNFETGRILVFLFSSLEIRVPFLDHNFTSYYLSIDEELRVPKKGIEKYLLRSAFDLDDLLPEAILWRPKEAFSDGVSPTSRSWHDIIQQHADQQVAIPSSLQNRFLAPCKTDS